MPPRKTRIEIADPPSDVDTAAPPRRRSVARARVKAADAHEKRLILSAIAKSQLSATHLLSEPAFRRHVCVMSDACGLLVGGPVCTILQEATESYLVDLLTLARHVAHHARRDDVCAADIKLVADIRGESLRFPSA